LQSRPDFAEAHYNLGLALRELGKLEEAQASFQEAIRLKPDFAVAHNNLAGALLEQGMPEQALASYRQAIRLQPHLAKAQTNVLFCLNCDPEADPDEVFEEHRRWGEGVRGQGLGVRDQKPEVRSQQPGNPVPLRVGYVSPDFRHHALITYFEPVLAHHDPERVEAICYAEVARPDQVTARLQKLAHEWRWTCGLSDGQVTQQVRDDRIDILVDLAGHTGNHRLGVFARKPAPVQVTWLGYLNTTGLSAVDCRLTDAVLDPPGEPRRDTEELYRLPVGMCCFAPPAGAPDVTPLPALRRGHLTFGSLHSLFKLNARVFDLWSRVLLALPNAHLLMFRNTLTDAAQAHIRRQFAERGISGERLDLRRGPYDAGYLAVYGEIDVSLDTFPCSGGVTTCESLWMGVPVLSLCGVRPMARNAASILTRVGLADWVVQTPDQYVAKAMRLSKELNQLAGLRAGLRERVRGTLCDAAKFTRALEDAFYNMWSRKTDRR
jgi:predicted O-linked N-acetylglucosamine transferase (SPINDLY family)